MKFAKLISNLFLILAFLPAISWAQEDLFVRKKSDTAIKPLVFPLSMVVIENRPKKGLYYFYEGETQKFDADLNGDPDLIENPFYSILSDAVVIKKTLVATDPTRIVPSEKQKDYLGPVTRSKLKKISHQYSKDLVLVFRREIHFYSKASLPESLFLHPNKLFNHKGSLTILIRSMGLVYLSKQNKALMVLANEKSISFSTEGKFPNKGNIKAGLHELSRKGLEDLASLTRKTIRDKQFVIRRPSY